MNKPTIKEFSRAYVRIYEHVIKQGGDWEALKASHTVEVFMYGMHKNGDCGARVRTLDGDDAQLGLEISFKVTYSRFIAPDVETWQEHYSDGKKIRMRTVDGSGAVRSETHRGAL